jgi:predicted XRE-type DNA-binding protein
MTTAEGITALLGFTPPRVVEFYNRKSDMFTSSKKFSEFRKEVNRDSEVIFQLLKGDDKDVEKAIRLMEELTVRIDYSGFSQKQITALKNAATTMNDSELLKIQQNLINLDNQYGLRAMQEIFEGSNE